LKAFKKFELKAGDSGNRRKNIICGVCIVVVLGTMLSINMNKAATVDIVSVKAPVYINRLITKENVTKYPMSKHEYENSNSKYLLWDDVSKAIDKYATVSTRGTGYLYIDEYSLDKPVKNEWLQNVDKNNLVVSLPYEKSTSFGNILTPGDRVKVHVSYTEQSGGGFGGTTDVSKVLYNEAKVIDLLNNAGNSIYDYYSDLLALPISERDTLLRDESFLQNVSPTRILYSVGKEKGFVDYADTQGKAGVKYTYGLYPRTRGDIILDQFSDLTRQISSAMTYSETAESKGGK